MCQQSKPKTINELDVTHHSIKRDFTFDAIAFILPALFFRVTNVGPLYLTAIVRMISTHAVLCLHYIFFDKHNYMEKISQAQLNRERKDYLVGAILHMWAQLFLQILFPGMFFVDDSLISNSAIVTLIVHVALVEPLYYVVHRWLHIPENMKAMHGFHHLSVHPIPSTSLVQNFKEHFIYIATFGPAMILPYFLMGYQHWAVIAAYLVLFDIVNAYGHTNIRCNHWLFHHKLSPVRYLIYTPEFHLGHHFHYNCNYGLFMPLWDHLFATFRDYKKPIPKLLPPQKQDFVFIAHNGGFGHLLTIPEVSFYNMYDIHRCSWLPLELELMLISIISICLRPWLSSYALPKFLVNGQYIGRLHSLIRTPLDYMASRNYSAINKDIVRLIRQQYDACGTRYYGLGNLNKMNVLNGGGTAVSALIKSDEYLKDKNIRIWTGDTLTAASVYQQMLDIPNLEKIFYIGGNGHIGNAVCRMLTKKDVKVCIFSKHQSYQHPNITYTSSISDMLQYKYVLIGKILNANMYKNVLENVQQKHQYLLDYTVPFIPLPWKSRNPNGRAHHIQIGVLRSTDKDFLRGYYDVCMGTDQNHIYPCHAGCLINMIEKREDDEIGEIQIDRMDTMWSKAKKFGLENKKILFE